MSRSLRALVPVSAVLCAGLAASLVHRQLHDPVRPGGAPPAPAEAQLEAPPTPLPPAGSPSELAERTAAQAQGWRRPPPTEHWLHDGAEHDNKKKRKDWIAFIHKAPPELDWKAVERANGLAQIAKRNELAGRWTSSTNGDPRVHPGCQPGRLNVKERVEEGKNASCDGSCQRRSARGAARPRWQVARALLRAGLKPGDVVYRPVSQ
jgi:hypothetical protein